MKKNILFLFAAMLLMTACNQQKTFKVNVSLANSNEKTIYLQKYVDNALSLSTRLSSRTRKLS